MAERERDLGTVALTTLRALRIAANSTPGNGDENFAAAVGIVVAGAFVATSDAVLLAEAIDLALEDRAMRWSMRPV